MNISRALEQATALLQDAEIGEARREASSLLSFVLGRDATFLIAHPEYTLSDSEEEKYKSYIYRRAKHEPFQYIVRRQEFYGLEFEVSPAVLIPRPETELLVEAAIGHLKLKTNPHFCEIGVGSGCISVTILHEIPTATAIAGDVSEKALALARKNAGRYAVDRRIEFRISNVFENLPAGPFDAILSNPPYIPEGDIKSLQPEVREFEPIDALTGGPSGLSIIERIIGESAMHLSEEGALIVEIGINQMAAVERLLEKGRWKNVEFLPDLQDIPRIVCAKRRS